MAYSGHEVDKKVELGTGLKSVVEVYYKRMVHCLQYVSFGESMDFFLLALYFFLGDNFHRIALISF